MKPRFDMNTYELAGSLMGLELICTALGGIAPCSPCERDPCLAPLGPATGPGQPRTGCSPGDIPLGAARPPRGPAQHMQTQLPTRSAADSRHPDWTTTVDSDNVTHKSHNPKGRLPQRSQMTQHTQCQPGHHYNGTTIGYPHHRVRAGHQAVESRA